VSPCALDYLVEIFALAVGLELRALAAKAGARRRAA
jgi:hypothetical protein